MYPVYPGCIPCIPDVSSVSPLYPGILVVSGIDGIRFFPLGLSWFLHKEHKLSGSTDAVHEAMAAMSIW
jgi:hypothetical protein